MGWTKRQYLEQAFDIIGLSSYVYDLTSSEFQSALRQMDAMIATWDAKGVRISYPLPSSPTSSSLDVELEVPDIANEAIYTNVAIRIAPSFGKVVPIEVKAAASYAFDALLAISARPLEMQLPRTMPRGAGNKPWRVTNDPFVSPPVDRLDKDLHWLTNSYGSYGNIGNI